MDICTAPWLAEELRGAQRRAGEIIVDLEQVEFMDCCGLRVLLNAVGEADAGHARLAVTPGGPQVQRLFELSGMDRELRFVPHSTSVAA